MPQFMNLVGAGADRNASSTRWANERLSYVCTIVEQVENCHTFFWVVDTRLCFAVKTGR